MGAYKKFSEELYKKYDEVACQRILDYVISTTGIYAMRNPDKYGPDIIQYNGFKPSSYIEVEMKLVWKSHQDTFPWDEINVPERKLKFLKVGLPISFWLLREDMNMAIVVPDYLLEAAPLIEVPNKFKPQGELFAKISVSQCQVIDMD